MFVYLKKATGRQTAGTWWADLSAEGFSRHTLQLPGSAPRSAAVTAMGRLYARLLSALGPALPAAPVVPTRRVKFAELLDQWLTVKEAATDGGADYVDQYAGLVRRELGHHDVEDLTGYAGTRLLQTYRDGLAARGLGPKTRRNRLNIIEQVIRFGVREGVAQGVPDMPLARVRGERVTGPVYDYLDEASLRAARQQLYREPATAGMLARAFWSHLGREAQAERVQAYVAARRLYFSVGFYTGMRKRDIDETMGADFSVDVGRHRRRGSKTQARPVWLDSPEQLIADLHEARAFMGRYWTPDAPVCGGPWQNVAAVARDVADALKLTCAPVPRILRRSFVRQLALRGWPKEKVREHMGHKADSALIETVYQDCPEAPARCFKGAPLGGIPWTVESTRVLEGSKGHEGARVVRLDRGGRLFGE